MRKYKVLLVEDDPMARTLFSMYVKNSTDYELVESIGNAAMAEIYCLKNKIDLILMDVLTDFGASGLKAAENIKRNYPGIRVIVITSMPECEFINRARAARVDSFWYKEPSEEKLLEVMDQTMQGISVYPDMTPMLQIGTAHSEEFSPTELKILRELTGGDTDEAIAEKLGISTWTVRKYIKTMLEKTNFKSRTQLAVAARESGLVVRGY